ncbi:hypothetical protein [Tolypothrix sp. VBCCA 56010]|uniref:hypothetical protein n=1 Tax=Tolypothrix sp. VBCCA 56010 TaxID=3137731 RepID=UPI003D7C5FD1
MRQSDPTSLFLGVAALSIAIWLHIKNTELHAALVQCRSDFQAFKEGVLYVR